MTSFLAKILTTTLAIMIATYLMPGVHVDNIVTALILSLVLAILNALVKPLLILFTLPLTILTLGLFLVFINTFIILIASNLVNGFDVDGFWYAFFFSLVLSFVNSLLEGFQQMSSGKEDF